MKKKKHNTPQVNHLLRVLDTLNGFELVICGYQSLNVFREMTELVRENLRAKKINMVDIDISSLPDAREFENLLKRKAGQGKQYRVFNIVGLEHHIKIGKVSRFLNQLNLLRDRLAADYPYGFFFWLPENLLSRFALDAPDLWAWRNTSVVFEAERESYDPEGTTSPPDADEGNFENFTFKEKQRQIEYLEITLNNLLEKTPILSSGEKIAQIYSDLGNLYYLIGSYDRALEYFEESLKLRTAVGDQVGISLNYNNIGFIYQAYGDYERALEYYRKGLDISERLGDRSSAASIYANIGLIYRAREENDAALKAFKQSLNISRELKDRASEGINLNNIARIYYDYGKYKTALHYNEQSLNIHREIGNKFGEGLTLSNIGMISLAQGDYNSAIKYLKRSLKISRETGDKRGEGHRLLKLAIVYFKMGRVEEAETLLEKSVTLNVQLKDAGLTRAFQKVPEELIKKMKLPQKSKI